MRILRELREISRLLRLVLLQNAAEDTAVKAAIAKEGENG